MFRKMRRFRQQLTDEECKEILRSQPRGVLALAGDDGYPYAVPIDFIYDESTNTLGFHSAGEGHKIDAIRRSDKASFCVYDEGYRNEGEWALNIKSVIIFGKIMLVTDTDHATDICRRLGYKFTDDAEYIENDIRKNAARVQCLELKIEHMTGKLVNES